MSKKNTLNYPKSAAKGFFPGTQEQVRNNRGERAISVQAIEVQLYMQYVKLLFTYYFSWLLAHKIKTQLLNL